MAQSKVHLTEEKATLLITLLAKAEDSKLPNSLLQDRFALEVIEQIDYDFDKLKVSRNLAVGLALRAKVLDDWARKFIAKHPNATVLNMGCGLDSRVFELILRIPLGGLMSTTLKSSSYATHLSPPEVLDTLSSEPP